MDLCRWDEGIVTPRANFRVACQLELTRSGQA